jgi:hypothetical protein
MSEIIETLLLRNLQEVFGERDSGRRRAAVEELYAEDCVVLLPIGRYVGHQALDQIAGELRGGHPSFVYTPQVLHRRSRTAVASLGAPDRPESRPAIPVST